MDPLLPRLEGEERRRRGRTLFRHSKIPVRMLVPNFFTLLSLCAGLTAIRMAIEQRYEMAIALVVIAACWTAWTGAWRARSRPSPSSAPSSTASPTSSTSAWRRPSSCSSGA
jgi:hypothetical protein